MFLFSYQHTHIVPLVGICVNPLAIVLELAPRGALDQRLKHYQRSGDKSIEFGCHRWYDILHKQELGVVN